MADIIVLFCNACGSRFDTTFRKIARFDGRFCSTTCLNAFELKRAQSILDRVPPEANRV